MSLYDCLPVCVFSLCIKLTRQEDQKLFFNFVWPYLSCFIFSRNLIFKTFRIYSFLDSSCHKRQIHFISRIILQPSQQLIHTPSWSLNSISAKQMFCRSYNKICLVFLLYSTQIFLMSGLLFQKSNIIVLVASIILLLVLLV